MARFGVRTIAVKRVYRIRRFVVARRFDVARPFGSELAQAGDLSGALAAPIAAANVVQPGCPHAGRVAQRGLSAKPAIFRFTSDESK